MIVRRCSQGHHIRLHRNTTKGVTRKKIYKDGTVETLTYPSSYNYFLDVDGEIVKKSNSFKVIEEEYVKECNKKGCSSHGRLINGKHHLINNVATDQDDYPSMSNTKEEIQAFYDARNISYKSNETKSELLSRIYYKYDNDHNIVSKHLNKV